MRRYPDHDCMCRRCHPEMFPSGDRQHEGHVALRLGDSPALPIDVYLDDERLTDCDEAIPGATVAEPGTVVRYTAPVHQCCLPVRGEMNSGVCAHVQRGHVRVVMKIAK